MSSDAMRDTDDDYTRTYTIQVDELMAGLESCQPHYIRCIKPNDKKTCDFLDMQRLQHQVQYLGLRENVMVRRSGFTARIKFANFLSRYSLLCEESWAALTSSKKKKHQASSSSSAQEAETEADK